MKTTPVGTIEEIEMAPMFSVLVWNGETSKPRRRRLWAFFDAPAWDDDVEAELERRGVRAIQETANRIDEKAPPHYTDDHALLSALMCGERFVKIPDDIGSTYFRAYRLEPQTPIVRYAGKDRSLVGLEGRAVARDGKTLQVDWVVPLARNPRKHGTPGHVFRVAVPVGEVEVLPDGFSKTFRDGMKWAATSSEE